MNNAFRNSLENIHPICGQELETAIASICPVDQDVCHLSQRGTRNHDTNGWVFNLNKYGETWRQNSNLTPKDVFNLEYKMRLDELAAATDQENNIKDRSRLKVTFNCPASDKQPPVMDTTKTFWQP